jgi:hypothetical protein
MASDLAPADPRGRCVVLPAARAGVRWPASGVRLSFPCRGADLKAAQACEQIVFGRLYGNTPAQLRAEYGPFWSSTSFGAVLLPGGRAVGAVRLLRGGPSRLKTMQDAARPPWSLPIEAVCRNAGLDLATTWDVGTFGVDAERIGAGNRSATLALFSVMFGAFRDNGVASFVAVLDDGARRPIAALGVKMTDLPGAQPAPYLGSAASVPAYASVAELHRTHAVDFSEIHGQVFHGRGIDGVDPAVAEPGHFTLPGGSCLSRLTPVGSVGVVPAERGGPDRASAGAPIPR